VTVEIKEPFSPGEIVGAYELTNLLHLGQNNAIYLAQHKMTQRQVVLAALLPHLAVDSMQVKRCMQAAKAMARIKHEGVVEIYDFGMTQKGLPYKSMKYLDGRTLRTILLQESTLPPSRVRFLFAQAAAAMESVHQKNIIHRDLKPSHLIVENDASEKVTVIDFHACRTIDPAHAPLTETLEIVGTPAYMSPEQSLGKPADQRSDIYGLGRCMYEAISGKKATSSDPAIDTISKQLSEQSKDDKDHTLEFQKLSSIVLKCLAIDPDDRYQSMAALQKDLLD